MQIYRTLLLTLLLLCPPLSGAVELTHLHEVTLPAADQSATERTRLIRQAMEILLQRLSGLRILPPSTPLNSALAQAEAVVEQYSYRSENGATLLEVRFEPSSMERILTEAQLPIWGSERPQMMLWLVISEGSGEPVLVDRYDSGLASEVIQQIAEQRGVPLLLPDLNDAATQAIAPTAITRTLDPRMVSIATAHEAPILLHGYLRPVSGGQWQANWNLSQNGAVSSWEQRSATPSTLLTQAIHQVADQLGSVLAFRVGAGGSRSRLVLQINDIDSFSAYFRVLTYLQGIPALQPIQLLRVEGKQMQFQIQPKGRMSDIERLLDLGGILQVDSSTPATAKGESLPTADLTYRLLPR